jgi:anti-sigma factor RsiW
MTGEHDIDFLQAYADGELDPAAMAEFEKKLASDPKLRAKYESILSLRRLIRTVPDDNIPAERLRSKAVSAISQRPTQRRNSWRALAAAALVGAVLSGAGTSSDCSNSLRGKTLRVLPSPITSAACSPKSRTTSPPPTGIR